MANFYGDLAKQVGSDDESQISDVDPSQLAKMVEDIDDLDAGLFHSSFSKKQEKPSSTKTVVKSALKSSTYDDSSERPQKSHVTFDSPEKSESKKYVKKNIDFGEFDADDPLGDLLSDEDEYPSKTKKKDDIFKSNSPESTKKQESESDPLEPKNKQNRAKVMAELFGLEEEKKQLPKQSPSDRDSSSSWLGLKDPQPAENKTLEIAKAASQTHGQVAEITASKKSVTSKRTGSGGSDYDDDRDLLSGMGFGSETRGNVSSQPKSRLDELLGKDTPGSKDTSPQSMLDDILAKKTLPRDRMSAGDGKRNAPHQTQPSSGVSFGNYSPSVSAPARRPTSRRDSGTATLPDPLGIFSPASSPTKESRQSSSSNLGHKTTDRLDISDTKPPPVTVAQLNSLERRQQVPEENPLLPDWLGGGRTVVTETAQIQPVPAAAAEPATASVPLPQAVGRPVSVMGILAAGSQMDQQVAVSLQHQEMQLLTALHLKQHEERLSVLQVRQQKMLEHQEQQLEELIRRQMDRQEQLNAHVRSQQERISSHIQLLLAQPVVSPVATSSPVRPSAQPAVDHKADESQVMVEQETSDKRHLTSALESLKAKHLEELQLLQDSYKRQIALLESSSERQIQRLHAENESLEREHQAKITRIQEEHASLIEQHQMRLAAQQKEHAKDLQELRELHTRDLEEARKQHSDILEHLNRARALESDALKEASSYSRSLHEALEQLGRNSRDLSGLQTELSSQHHSQLDAREATLQARETELRVIRENLEKQRVASEEERQRLVGLVSQLEQKLAEQRQSAEEERWNLRQEAARLDAATKALEKERERAMQQIDVERQQLQNLKESMLSEQQILRQQLQQEKLSLASEKSRLETMARLHDTTSPDISKLRAELETGIGVAREASQRAESEREKLQNQQRHLDDEQRRLKDFEHDLTSKAREVETLTKMAVATKEEGRWALEEARRIEKQRSEQTAEIQRQLAELRDREKRLAQEKVFLSQERLALRNQRSRDLCLNCRRPTAVTLSPPPTPPDLGKRFVDPKLIIMKLAAEDKASQLEEDSHFFSSQFSASK